MLIFCFSLSPFHILLFPKALCNTEVNLLLFSIHQNNCMARTYNSEEHTSTFFCLDYIFIKFIKLLLHWKIKKYIYKCILFNKIDNMDSKFHEYEMWFSPLQNKS